MQRQRNVVICETCDYGMSNTSMRMRVHSIVPGVRCEGSRKPGRLGEDVERHEIVDILWGLLSPPDGVIVRWRWFCSCTQKGAWEISAEQAERNGAKHVVAFRRNSGKRGGVPGRDSARA